VGDLPLFYDKFVLLISTGHERSVKAKKNIAALVLFKGISIIISFMLVPMTLQYLNPVQYGIWLTLSSVIAWFGFFDIGLGNGLRNKFVESIAKGNAKQARMYVSTTYAILSIVISAVFVMFLFVNPYLSWPVILNADVGLTVELRTLALIVFTFFCVKFVVGLLNILLLADQKPASANLLEVLSNLLSLLLIYILVKKTSGSLIYLGMALGISTTIIPLLASFWYFRHKYRIFAPSLRYVKLTSARELMNIGLQFFVIQIVALIIFMTSNMVIAQLFGPREVTSYNIAFKYFSVITIAFNIIITPFWSAYADAYHRDDITWIKDATKRLIFMWAISIFGAIGMVVVARQVYLHWVGPSIEISLSLSVAMALYVTISNWNNIYASFINGSGKIRLQLYSSIAVGIVNIPLSIVLAKYCGLGITGVVFASCACLIVSSFWAPLQYSKIVNKTATGIWAK
jgi:O-antigen/teichoic acid export membrane protein